MVLLEWVEARGTETVWVSEVSEGVLVHPRADISQKEREQPLRGQYEQPPQSAMLDGLRARCA